MLTYSQAKECIKDLDRSGLESLIESLGEEVVEAALTLDIPPADIEEAYQGKYESHSDFAYGMASQLGLLDKEAKWPMSCIDWEQAGKELMYDYCEEGGCYFRNL